MYLVPISTTNHNKNVAFGGAFTCHHDHPNGNKIQEFTTTPRNSPPTTPDHFGWYSFLRTCTSQLPQTTIPIHPSRQPQKNSGKDCLHKKKSQRVIIPTVYLRIVTILISFNLDTTYHPWKSTPLGPDLTWAPHQITVIILILADYKHVTCPLLDLTLKTTHDDPQQESIPESASGHWKFIIALKSCPGM